MIVLGKMKHPNKKGILSKCDVMGPEDKCPNSRENVPTTFTRSYGMGSVQGQLGCGDVCTGRLINDAKAELDPTGRRTTMKALLKATCG